MIYQLKMMSLILEKEANLSLCTILAMIGLLTLRLSGGRKEMSNMV